MNQPFAIKKLFSLSELKTNEHQPVEDRSSDDGVTEDRAPVGQRPVRRHDRRVALLVAGVDDLEEHCGRFGAADREESDVVDHQHGWRGEGLHLRSEVALDRCPDEGAAEVGADEAGDQWFVANWHRLDESEIERLFDEVFAIFRRMLEPPPG